MVAVALGAYGAVQKQLSSDLFVLFAYEGPPFLGRDKFWLDIASGLVVSLLFVFAAWLLFAFVLRLGRWLPTATGRIGTGSFIALIVLFNQFGFSFVEALAFAAILVLLIGAVFGSLASFSSGHFSEKGLMGKLSVWGFCGAGLAGMGLVGYGLTHKGTGDHLTEIPSYEVASEPVPLTIADPGRPGSLAGQTVQLTYGSGTDIHRPEFGAEADIITKPVNGRPFAKLQKGHKGKVRELFWQFDLSEMPRNGRVWYPKGDGPFPLVLMVHGNHSMREFSDTGYAYLGEHLASHGYIFCSVDQNFINGNLRRENDARGWLLLEHLKLWAGWNGSEGSPFFGKVDMDAIALMGHSRGGEAVTHAALFNRLAFYPDDASVVFDYNFGIKAIVSIAPVDGQYQPAGRYTRLRDINYFTMHGSHDGDVTQFYGDRIYNRLSFGSESDAFKSSLYLYRANHGQWNTVWGATDWGGPGKLLLNREALMAGDEQRQIAKVYITAFLAATIRSNRAYLPLFTNPRTGRDWLPDATLIHRFEDASFRLIADYEEDADVTTTSLPGGRIHAAGLVVYREADIALRGDKKRYNQGAFLGWNREPEEQSEADAQAVEAAGSGDGRVADASAVASADVSADEGAVGVVAVPSYEIRFPAGYMAGLQLKGTEHLVMHLAEVDEKPKAKDYAAESANDNDSNDDEASDSKVADAPDAPRPAVDFSVELLCEGGSIRLPLSRFGRLAPPLEAETKRTEYIGRTTKKTELTLQMFALPFAAFKTGDRTVDLASVSGIRLVFDRQAKGVIVVDRVGIANRPE